MQLTSKYYYQMLKGDQHDGGEDEISEQHECAITNVSHAFDMTRKKQYDDLIIWKFDAEYN